MNIKTLAMITTTFALGAAFTAVVNDKYRTLYCDMVESTEIDRNQLEAQVNFGVMEEYLPQAFGDPCR